VIPCFWECNRRSGIALAMRHRLQWLICLWAQPNEGRCHPAYTAHGLWRILPFTFVTVVSVETGTVPTGVASVGHIHAGR